MITAIPNQSFGRKYIHGYLRREMILDITPIHLPNFNNQGHFTWNILDRVFKLLNVEEMKESMCYQDPWTGNEYYFWYPEWMLTKNLDFYRQYINADDEFWSKDGFKHFIHTNEETNSLVDIGMLTRAFLGHGYTTDYLPSDGETKLREFIVALDNGDYLFGHGWEWDND